ncbi:hypothetical protein CTRI78_v006547 [Colletotrichum trifolii]|uniref:Uncharacterized protein n=1 Tax=Colletotrichum trifolii TaxID=5466 RepID=A0A4R8RIV5_COLTR|nr:hypothetical protein CTRI78_v006547 [Colletotrichum trifolii]
MSTSNLHDVSFGMEGVTIAMEWNFLTPKPQDVEKLEIPIPFTRFQLLPGEVKDIVYKEAYLEEENEPKMRFVDLHQTVRHVVGCDPASAACQCRAIRPNYLTFHPLLRSTLTDPGWTALRLSTNRSSRRRILSQVSGHSRDYVNTLDSLDPYTHTPGDWSLTKIAQHERTGDVVGDPYLCKAEDLVCVRIPTTTDRIPLYDDRGVAPQVTFDPLLEQLTSIAVTFTNWEELSYDDGLEHVYDTMAHHHMWRLIQDHGVVPVLEGNMPANWPPPDVQQNPIWHPDSPQRVISGPAGNANPAFNPNWWRQNMRVVTDVFPSLAELWVLDLSFIDVMASVDPLHLWHYRNHEHDSAAICEDCNHRHLGTPRTWGGIEEYEFMELRVCSPEFSLAPFDRFSEFLFMRMNMMYAWPDSDVNDVRWARRLPDVRLVVPVPRRVIQDGEAAAARRGYT